MDREGEIKAVLDTSVLLSAARRPLLLLAMRGYYTIVWSEYIVAEVERKIVEMGWGTGKAVELVSLLNRLAETVDYRQITGGSYEAWLTDLDDHPIMATALVGRVDYLVTWNIKDFPPKQRFAGVTVLTPEAFLKTVTAKGTYKQE